MEDTGNEIEAARNASPRMTLGQALGIYAVCLAGAIFLLSPLVSLLMRWTRSPGLALLLVVVLHIAIGVFLNRRVLRRLVEWHFLATLEGVASKKVGLVVFWPFRYPVLFFQIGANKHL
jgi:hypothetical protein